MKALYTKKPIKQYLLQKGQIILPTQLILDCVSEEPKVQKKARLLTQLITRCTHDKTKFRVNNDTIFIETGSFHAFTELQKQAEKSKKSSTFLDFTFSK